MLITKTNPFGIDWYIQQLQNRLHAELVAAWGINDTNQYECYGRCYRNKKDNGYVAEVFTSGNEYKEVYWNDRLSAISFFGTSGNVKIGAKAETDVHLIFFVNLKKLKPAVLHRADEEVRQDVSSIIGKYSFGFSHNSTELWLETVLRDYPGNYRDTSLRVVDMHPIHCFRLNLKLIFDQNKIC